MSLIYVWWVRPHRNEYHENVSQVPCDSLLVLCLFLLLGVVHDTNYTAANVVMSLNHMQLLQHAFCYPSVTPMFNAWCSPCVPRYKWPLHLQNKLLSKFGTPYSILQNPWCHWLTLLPQKMKNRAKQIPYLLLHLRETCFDPFARFFSTSNKILVANILFVLLWCSHVSYSGLYKTQVPQF